MSSRNRDLVKFFAAGRAAALAAVAGVLAGSLSASSFAGVETTDAAASAAVSTTAPPPAASAQATHAGKVDVPKDASHDAAHNASLIRCWQFGRLVYEGRGFAALPHGQAAVEFKTTTAKPDTTQVLDLHQGLCVLELHGE
jgi:hypothetical protein